MFWAVICLGLIILVGGLVGCGSSTTSINYYYYYPDWTPDGKILCSKNQQVTTQGGGGFGGSGGSVSNNYYLTIMDADGSNERDIKSIGNSAKVAASPLGNYYAYAESDSNFIHVVATAGATVSDIDSGSKVYSLDWSSNDSSLVYNGTKEAFIVNVDGSNKRILSNNGSSVSWRYGGKIIVDNPITSEVFRIIALDGVSYSEIAQYSKIQGGEYNISKSNTNEVYYRSAYESGIKRFLLSSPEAEPTLLINRNDLWNIKISLDGQKILATGQNVSGADIWLINIDGTGLKQLK